MNPFQWIKGLFNKAISSFKSLFNQAFPVARQIILGYLSKVALNSVTRLNSTTLTNEEKRKEAFKEIKAYAITEGLEARDALINALIEISVLALKENGEQ